MGLLIEIYDERGEVDVISEPDTNMHTAVALWRVVNPGEQRQQPNTLPTTGGLIASITSSEHAANVGEGLSRIRDHVPAGPYVYLNVLGVEPTSQGAGLGMAAVESITTRAERNALPVHLETTNPDNVAWYEHRGFHVVSELRLAGQGPTLWAMTRRTASQP